MQCPSCGHDNPEKNRFCGECGRTLARPAARWSAEPAEFQPGGGLTAGDRPVKVVEKRKIDVKPDITGSADGSREVATAFLGAPAPKPGPPRKEWRSTAANSFLGLDAGGGSSDYLFEDEEGGFPWRGTLAIVVLLIFGYILYSQWNTSAFVTARAEAGKYIQAKMGSQSAEPAK